eukprot:365139-Chlamydomonas_euryale.AAC.17
MRIKQHHNSGVPRFTCSTPPGGERPQLGINVPSSFQTDWWAVQRTAGHADLLSGMSCRPLHSLGSRHMCVGIFLRGQQCCLVDKHQEAL